MKIIKSLSSKFFASFILLFAVSANLQAEDCNRKQFSIKVAENSNTSTLDILTQLSNTCSFSIIIKPSDVEASAVLREAVAGINIKDLSLHDIFEILISHNDLMYTFRKNILTVSSVDTRIFKIDYITSVREGRAVVKASADSAPVQLDDLTNQNQGGTGGGTTNQDNIIETTEKFDFWAQISAEIASIMNNGKENFKAPAPVVNSNAGLVSVTGTKGQLGRVAEYVAKLNKSLKKQVMIDVRIVSVELNNEYSRGVDWSKFNLGFNTYLDGVNPSQFAFGRWKNGEWDITTPSTSAINGGFILKGAININLDGVLNFLETTGSARVVSSPKIMTMNNQQALISVGDNINYQITNTVVSTETKTENVDVQQYSTFIGILLNLLPEVSDDGSIMLRINPSLNTFKYEEDNRRQEQARNIAPDTLQKKLSSVVHVNSGDTIVLGGLINQESGNTVKQVPVLGSIPLFGYLFKNDKKIVRNTELVFIITPKIIDIDSYNGIQDSLKSLGFSDGLF